MNKANSTVAGAAIGEKVCVRPLVGTIVHGGAWRNGTIDIEIAGLAGFSGRLRHASNLFTTDARKPVHNLWMNFHVGDVQRHKNPAKTRFPPGGFWLQ
jgi:hypothetical protein